MDLPATSEFHTTDTELSRKVGSDPRWTQGFRPSSLLNISIALAANSLLAKSNDQDYDRAAYFAMAGVGDFRAAACFSILPQPAPSRGYAVFTIKADQ